MSTPFLLDILGGKVFDSKQGFGNNWIKPNGEWAYATSHNGKDYSTPIGTSLFVPSCMKDVKIARGFDKGGYGNYIKFEDKNVRVLVGHLSEFLVPDGNVESGKAVVKTGNTGFSTGPHAHIVIFPLENGKLKYPNNGHKGAVDPNTFIYPEDDFGKYKKWLMSISNPPIKDERWDQPMTKQETAKVLNLFEKYLIDIYGLTPKK